MSFERYSETIRTVVINSKQTLEAVKFVHALFKEAMTPEVLNWDDASKNSFMLNGRGSLVVNAVSILRTAEKNQEMAEISKKIWLAKAPAGPMRRMGLEHMVSVYVIWKFAENIEGPSNSLLIISVSSEEHFLLASFTISHAIPIPFPI